MSAKYWFGLLAVVAIAAVAGTTIATDQEVQTPPTPAPADAAPVSVEAHPWVDAPFADEVKRCAAERNVEVYELEFDAIERTRVMGKGKGGNPCKTCATTLGSCARYSCSPCCYTCPDTPYLLCVE